MFTHLKNCLLVVVSIYLNGILVFYRSKKAHFAFNSFWCHCKSWSSSEASRSLPVCLQTQRNVFAVLGLHAISHGNISTGCQRRPLPPATKLKLPNPSEEKRAYNVFSLCRNHFSQDKNHFSRRLGAEPCRQALTFLYVFIIPSTGLKCCVFLQRCM